MYIFFLDLTSYRTVLGELGYSMPVFLYPFARGSGLFKDYGPHQLHLTKGRANGYRYVTDRFDYPDHVLYVDFNNKLNNISYFNADVSAATELFEDSKAFSFVFHIHTQHQMGGQDGALFVFSNPGSLKKFRVTSTTYELFLL